MPVTVVSKTRPRGVPFADIPPGEWFAFGLDVCVRVEDENGAVNTSGQFVDVEPDDLVQPLDVKISAKPLGKPRKPRGAKAAG